MEPADIGGVHIKYLHHCHRQLWLYSRGVRPEHLSERVRLGEALHEVSYDRFRPVDLGAAKLDHLDGDLWVHEVKSSRRPTVADEAQALHYCLRLIDVGVEARGAVLHYRPTRRTIRIPFDDERRARAVDDIAAVLDIVERSDPPERLDRPRCVGCSYLDYCWTD
ncbi:MULTISPECIES: CRISPR-associated protein Cas4 [Protofrankia]|uniref:CRISPR-associated protein Cas4 n=1 Tax=Protofrankia coriariae TaxID=1562887 RepID=A0ABR5F479_9ACTN|nr:MULTISPECIES: CRISPR-associated protein Cas4 [Protofrankia]KLL11490.1 CRISPR-associated protein Cas4 [Protofrankia coriariae]ONH34934.1 CRISPR-associated protein Cas4 [Protofrankia sp. BMG5.30]